MTNDDKVKLANEILAIDECFDADDFCIDFGRGMGLETPVLNIGIIKSIVSEWLQFTQFQEPIVGQVGECPHNWQTSLNPIVTGEVCVLCGSFR
jgi:hypothetical protein